MCSNVSRRKKIDTLETHVFKGPAPYFFCVGGILHGGSSYRPEMDLPKCNRLLLSLMNSKSLKIACGIVELPKIGVMNAFQAYLDTFVRAEPV